MSGEREPEGFAGWAIVELMGHVRYGGYVSEAHAFGVTVIRVDLPGDDAGTRTPVSVLCNPASLYRLTPVAEAVARRVAEDNPDPVSRWDLPPAYREAMTRYDRELGALARDDDPAELWDDEEG